MKKYENIYFFCSLPNAFDEVTEQFKEGIQDFDSR